MIARLATWLLAAATARIARQRPDWARAMAAEAAHCPTEAARLGWAWGCWKTGLRLALDIGWLVYAAALASGLALLATYEWSADESPLTLAILGLIAVLLGALRPRQALLSGVALGLVVASVLGFEALSGIRPAYEAQSQTIAQSLPWLALLIPAVAAAVAGARIGHRWRLPRGAR